jgi:lipoyl(octanoyl) transferase
LVVLDKIRWAYLGVVAYDAALSLQRNLHKRCRTERGHFLLLLQHPPTVTLGYRLTDGLADRLADGLAGGLADRPCRLAPQELRGLGINIVRVERGGGATYHGPGQLVAYPLFFLPAWRLGVRDFIGRLEEVMLRVVAAYGVQATRQPAYPGIWVGEEKIGAVGIAIKNRVSLHGFALNVNLDLAPFSYIVPCGLPNKGVTSLRVQTGRAISLVEVVQHTVEAFSSVFAAQLEEVTSLSPQAPAGV